MTNFKQRKESHRKIIGLLPAGGKATRLAPLPFSKELYPIGFQRLDNGRSLRPKPVCIYLLEKMRLAGITEAYVVLRDGKWDIPTYLGAGKMLDMHLAYLIMRLPFGVPYTLDQAYPFVQDVIVAFGFPDIIFQPEDAFERLLIRQANTNADIILGLFPVDQPQKWDMVDLNNNGRIRNILIKPIQTELCYTWIIAVWTPVFSYFMHEHLKKIQEPKEQITIGNNVSEQRELFMSEVIQHAIDNDLQVEAVIFPDDSCLDIGTPEDLVKAVRNYGRDSNG